MDRNRKNEEIFYRKRPNAEVPSKKATQSLSLGKNNFSERRVLRKGEERMREEVNLPLMLQKRPKRLEK